MPRLRLCFDRTLTHSVLFFTAILLVTSSDLNSAAIAQRITSPGLTTPIGTPSPTPVPNPSESPLPIPVPPPRNPLPGGTRPKPSTTPARPSTTPAPTASPPKFPTNHAGRILTTSERDKITAYLRSRNLSPAPTANALNDPRFILHDTSIILPPERLERERQEGRGPLGLGVNAYLPRDSSQVIARPNFYEPRRPTTTEFEKASDIMVLNDRERLFRQVWQATNSNARRQGLDTALANLGLSSGEIAKEQKEAADKLSASSGRIYTTGTWTIEAICNRYNQGDRSIVASADRESNLRNSCGTLTNYFNVRNSRIRSSVAAEILQLGTRSDQGNQNTCDANNSNIATLPNPAYSENQYDRTLALYLRAALAAGKFPQLTTHFALDTFASDAHCDPRCFNLTKLYQKSAAIMGHAAGSTYGIKPSYGTQLGTNNIWWHDRICHDSSP
jgi:hypothetical protein